MIPSSAQSRAVKPVALFRGRRGLLWLADERRVTIGIDPTESRAMTHLGKLITKRRRRKQRDHDALPKMFCLRCLYILDGLTGDRCPECGRGFDPSNPRTFSNHGSLRYQLRIRRWVLLIGVAAGLFVGILSTITWGSFNESWSSLVIVLNGPSMLLANEASNWVAMIILVVGPIISYSAFIVAVLYFRKWFVRVAVVVLIVAGHLWAAYIIMNQIMDALGAIL